MEAKTNYTVVGLAVVILLGGLIATALWLSVGFDQKEHKTYAVYMREAVSGLSEQSPVKFNGVKVGFVNKIALSQRDPREVKILLSIEKGTPITASTSATLISQGITGTTYVGLSADTGNLIPLQAAAGEPYPVIPSKPSIFNQLDKVLKDVSVNVNKVSKEIGRVFNDQNIENVNKALANIKVFTHVLARNSRSIQQSLKSAQVFLDNTAEASHEFPAVTHELKISLHKFNTMANALSDAGKSVSSTMESGKVTIDKFSQQTIPSANSLLERLNTIAANLEKVSIQLRHNPAVVIRGTTPPSPGPGE